MKYQLTQIKTDGTCHRWVQDKKPALDELQEAVGGLIDVAPECYWEQPALKNICTGEISDVWCNDEALLVDEPKPNLFFEPAPWGDRLYGDVLVVEKVRA